MIHWTPGERYASMRAGSYDIIDVSEQKLTFTSYTQATRSTDSCEAEIVAKIPGSTRERLKYVLKTEEGFQVIFVKAKEKDLIEVSDHTEETYDTEEDAREAKAYEGMEYHVFRPLHPGEEVGIAEALEIDEYMDLFEKFISRHKSNPQSLNALKNAKRKEPDIHYHLFKFAEAETPGKYLHLHEFKERMKLSEIMYQRYPEVMVFAVQTADLLKS